MLTFVVPNDLTFMFILYKSRCKYFPDTFDTNYLLISTYNTLIE